MSPAGTAPGPAGGKARSPYVMAVAFRPGTDAAGARARLDRRLAAVDQSFYTQSAATPADLVNFGLIQDLPVILGSVSPGRIAAVTGQRKRRGGNPHLSTNNL